jgi:hypothetical protein
MSSEAATTPGRALAPSRPSPWAPIELVSEKLWLIGANVPLEGLSSWEPEGVIGYQPFNTYVITGAGEETYVVDPGAACLEHTVISGLAEVLPPGARPRIFLTRAQLDAIGNLGAVAAEFSVQDVFTGGFQNPFDSFDAITTADAEGRAANVLLFRSPEESRMQVINPPLRILATFWAYDHDTKTLFTSDSFVHGILQEPGERPVIDENAIDQISHEDVRAHLFAALWWLPYADLEPIVAAVDRVFRDYDVELIAPGRGCILQGKGTVERHAEMLIDVLESAMHDSTRS